MSSWLSGPPDSLGFSGTLALWLLLRFGPFVSRKFRDEFFVIHSVSLHALSMLGLAALSLLATLGLAARSILATLGLAARSILAMLGHIWRLSI